MAHHNEAPMGGGCRLLVMRGHPLSPQCRFCDEEATRWRLPDNPPWGLDPQFNPIEERIALALWRYDGPPDTAYGTCDEHFYHEFNAQGNLVLSAAGKHARKKTDKNQPTLTKAEMDLRYRVGVRGALVNALGGECVDCGETDSVRLRVEWPDRTRPPGLEGLPAMKWYRALLADEELQRRAVLRCSNHPVPAASADRDAVIAAYGGACAGCGTESGLWVVPQQGTHPPRYPGGRKYGSTDKLRWLVRQGFPKGWELRCPPCTAGVGGPP